ncbi:hypothetical protein J6590_032196 [Homalodisca vitripennis]|nr:hypothetical protein J6590_032196 [Homalodisca vitripennis]
MSGLKRRRSVKIKESSEQLGKSLRPDYGGGGFRLIANLLTFQSLLLPDTEIIRVKTEVPKSVNALAVQQVSQCACSTASHSMRLQYSQSLNALAVQPVTQCACSTASQSMRLQYSPSVNALAVQPNSKRFDETVSSRTGLE